MSNSDDVAERLMEKNLEIERLKRALARAEEEKKTLLGELCRPVPPKPKTPAQLVAEAQAKAASSRATEQDGSARKAQPYQDTTAGNSPAAVHAPAQAPDAASNS